MIWSVQEVIESLDWEPGHVPTLAYFYERHKIMLRCSKCGKVGVYSDVHSLLLNNHPKDSSNEIIRQYEYAGWI